MSNQYFYDYISIVKPIPFNEINFSKSFFDGYKTYGLQMRKLTNKKTIDVNYDERSHTLNVKGSIPYFVQGHNLFSSMAHFETGIANISNTLQVDLSDAKIKEIEVSTSFETPIKPNHYFESHLSLPGYNKSRYDHGLVFTRKESRNIYFKFYDIIKRLLQTNISILKEFENLGIIKNNHNYLRFELHLQDLRTIKSLFEREIYLSDILTQDFYNEITSVIPVAYEHIIKTKSCSYNFQKKDSDAVSNALRAFLSFEEKFNDSLINIMTDYLQKAPKDVISPQNRSNQLKTLRQGYKKALKTTRSHFDLIQKFEGPAWFASHISPDYQVNA